MRLQIIVDDDLGYELAKLNNKSEYIRQAIIEKLARDKNQDSEKSEAKEFMEVIKNLQKTMLGNNELLLDIQQKIIAHESKTIMSQIKNKNYFYGLMIDIYKINMISSEAAGFDFIQENKAAIQIEAKKNAIEFIEKYNV